MRYPREHKEVTRRRIIDAAGQAFRERGVAETGVDEVMRRAGLTHGGFYAHFRDKTELIAEACAAAFDAAVPNLHRIASAETPAARARLLIDSYLGARHRDNRGSGCLVVAVGADMVRLRGAARAGYAKGFAKHLERLADALRLSPDPALNRERVTQLMSTLVGALLFARAIDDPVQSDAMLHGMRRQLRAHFCSERDSGREIAGPAPVVKAVPTSPPDSMAAESVSAADFMRTC
jgi:TetR/AcrR family transcriptional repressor of nem operon